MVLRPVAVFLLLAGLGPAAAPAQQRIEFQRQKFDRSRFERAGQPAAAPATAPAAAAEPAGTIGGAEPLGGAEPAGTPAPMVTTAPDPSSYTFSTNPAPRTAPASAPGAVPGSATVFSSNSVLPPRPPGGPAYPADATPEEKAAIDAPPFDQLPTKWYGSAKDHEELAALQRKTGACLIVYFKNFAVPNEKGLCSWFEKTVTTDMKWRKAMRYYLKLEVTVPGTSAVEELVAKYRANKTPALFVVKPGATQGTRIKLFDYPANSRPEPLEAAAVLEAIKAASTPAYQPLF